MFQKKVVWFRDVQTLTKQSSRNVCLSSALECVILWLLSPGWYASPQLIFLFKSITLKPRRLGQFPALSQMSCMTYNKLLSLPVCYFGDWRVMPPYPKGHLSIHINQSCARLLMDTGTGGESECLCFIFHGISPWEMLIVLSGHPS